MSLLPPPWLELTTSDPSTRAVRVRPPGRIQVVVPLTMYGRRSTWRGAVPALGPGRAGRESHNRLCDELRGLATIFARNSSRWAWVEDGPMSMP